MEFKSHDLEDRDLNTIVDLEQTIAKIDSLPTMPVIARKLLALDPSTDEGEAMLLALIGFDPLISAKIIGLANASHFGTHQKSTSISNAAMRLGLTRVKSVAISIAVMSILTKPQEGQLKANALWLNSLSIAFSMDAITKAMPAGVRPLVDDVFLAGLLHDIGYMVLAYLDTQASDALYLEFQTQADLSSPGMQQDLFGATHSDRSILKIEQALLGMTHCEIGALLGQRWELPEEIITAIRYHHTPDQQEGSGRGQPLARMVSIADKILPEFSIAKQPKNEVSEQEWIALGIDPSKVDDILFQVREIAVQARDFAGTF
jgi:HD-like signal output (HDOD) protein